MKKKMIKHPLHVDKSRIFHPQKKITVEKMFFSSWMTWGDFFFVKRWNGDLRLAGAGFLFHHIGHRLIFMVLLCYFSFDVFIPNVFGWEKNPWRIVNYRLLVFIPSFFRTGIGNLITGGQFGIQSHPQIQPFRHNTQGWLVRHLPTKFRTNSCIIIHEAESSWELAVAKSVKTIFFQLPLWITTNV